MNRTLPFSSNPRTRMAWVVVGLTILISVVCFWMFLQNRPVSVPASWGSSAGPRSSVAAFINSLQQTLIAPPAFSLLGLLIVKRQPHNRIGRLMLALGLGLTLIPLSAEVAVAGYYRAAPPLPIAYTSALISNVIWLMPYTLLIWMIAIFPDGEFASRTWKHLVTFSLTLFILPNIAYTLFEPQLTSGFQIPNVIYLDAGAASPDIASALLSIGSVFMVGSVVLVLVSIVRRYRRSDHAAQLRIKWLLVSLVIMAVTLAVGLMLAFQPNRIFNPIGQILVNLTLFFPIAGIAIAILRYRLYDIDILIRRTLQYSIVTGVLALVYFTGVVILQGLFQRQAADAGSPLITVVSTLAIASLFNPVRSRAQRFVDRRFYRSTYDAERTLERFASAARDEVNLDALAEKLLAAVQESVQPSSLMILIERETGREKSERQIQ